MVCLTLIYLTPPKIAFLLIASESLGVTQATTSYLVNSKTNPSLDTLQRIAEILEVRIWRLFYKETPKELQSEQPSVPQSQTIICHHCGKPIELEVKAKKGN